MLGNIVQAVWVLLAAEIVLRVFIKIYWARRHAFRAYQVNIKTCPVNHHARNACLTQKAKMQIQQNVIIAELVKNPKLVVLNVQSVTQVKLVLVRTMNVRCVLLVSIVIQV